MVFKVDGTTGAILSSLHSTNGAVRFISEAVVFDRYLHFYPEWVDKVGYLPVTGTYLCFLYRHHAMYDC